MEIQEKLEILIKRNNYKKSDFAAALGITYRALANYINGSRFPRQKILSDMAILLDTEESVLTDNNITLTLSPEEKLYFYGTSGKEVLENADEVLSSVEKLLADKSFTSDDKTAFFNCIAEKYFKEKAKNSDAPIGNELLSCYNTNS
ncbi:MAG: helix-turn-helix transcriptional regulator [Ruminiclostridium sp.]|nr:helix-turn-helix transcriptional regulator [Ruminiclostridium sp.]